MENVMGSFYSREELHQYCYTLYSLWGQPEKKRERFRKGAIVKLHFFLNASRRAFPDPSDGLFRPKYNLPSTPAIQLAFHSPYHLRSPYVEGNNFIVGRSYEIRLTMSEKHLLPAPYQTNCTNYLEEWKLRGGKAPINQLDVIQECRMKRYYEGMRCVPVNVDYPHEHPICKMCPEEKCNCPWIRSPSCPVGRVQELVFHIAAPPLALIAISPEHHPTPFRHTTRTVRRKRKGAYSLSTWGPLPREHRRFLSLPPISASQLVITARTTKVQTDAISRLSDRRAIRLFHK
ncbi:hypothetical protein AVEN_15013-1 [Araneus ventricosus]|uniref:Uncharacterized protein n=1 Tax=Araneus ventricosus TaxID=182803 RepID=A0A4Y2FTZ3_ARAVE|nr:hypothetical protein AVEN_15013-1 [Araneus ventricosus]